MLPVDPLLAATPHTPWLLGLHEWQGTGQHGSQLTEDTSSTSHQQCTHDQLVGTDLPRHVVADGNNCIGRQLEETDYLTGHDIHQSLGCHGNTFGLMRATIGLLTYTQSMT